MTSPCAPLPALSPPDARALRRRLTADPLAAAVFARTAGMRVAEAARAAVLAEDPRGRRVVVVTHHIAVDDPATQAALWLAAWGADVVVIGDGKLDGLPTREAPAAGDDDVDLVIDGLSGLEPTRPGEDDLVAWLAAVSSPVLAVDRPSGFDLDHNALAEPSVRAVATVALGVAVELLLHFDVSDAVGDVLVADLGLPPALWAELGGEGAAFALSGLVDGR